MVYVFSVLPLYFSAIIPICCNSTISVAVVGMLLTQFVFGFGSFPPPCDYSTHDYKLSGTEMTCVARDPEPSELLWYNMEAGKCTVTSANETHVIFKIAVDSAVLFTSVPHRKVLNPSQTAQLSNMSHYDGKAVVLSYDVGGQMHLYTGKGSVRTDGQGQLVGERLAGAKHAVLDAPIDCVLDEVKSVEGASGVGFGECTFSGNGRVDITLQALHAFTGAGVLVPTEIDDPVLLVGVNAATHTKNGNYEVFTISQVNKTHVSGFTYFSTRPQTWPNDFSPGEKLVEECSLFIDVTKHEFVIEYSVDPDYDDPDYEYYYYDYADYGDEWDY